jgi:K+-transporting ATPase c subunit
MYRLIWCWPREAAWTRTSVRRALSSRCNASLKPELDESKVRTLIEEYIEPLQFGILGLQRVNVLKLNLALDELTRGSKR